MKLNQISKLGITSLVSFFSLASVPIAMATDIKIDDRDIKITQNSAQTVYYPSGKFTDGTWVVSLENCNYLTCFYKARNIKTGVSLNLNNYEIRGEGDVINYIFLNNGYRHEVRWTAANEYSLNVRIFKPTGDRIRTLNLTHLTQKLCTIADPTGTPLNVRDKPNGKWINRLRNGRVVYLHKIGYDRNNRPWANIGGYYKGVYKEWGWVFKEYIGCRGDH
ncbi:MAG: hypothetical protein AAFX46_12260 [Cyanobacteria bacterium J06636_27]